MWSVLLVVVGLASTAPVRSDPRRVHQRVTRATHALATAPTDDVAPPYPRRAPQKTKKLIYVDGNNLMMQRKVTKGRDDLAGRLRGVRGAEVVIVFDGRDGEQASEAGDDPRVVVTAGGGDGYERVSADEWIMDEVDGLPSRDVDVEVVTADRHLRRQAQLARAKTINPIKFYRRYLPRLKGLKSDYSNTRKPIETAEQ